MDIGQIMSTGAAVAATAGLVKFLESRARLKSRAVIARASLADAAWSSQIDAMRRQWEAEMEGLRQQIKILNKALEDERDMRMELEIRLARIEGNAAAH